MSLVTQMMRDLEAEKSAAQDQNKNELPLFAAANLLYGKHHQPTAKRARLILIVALVLALGLLFVDRVLLAPPHNLIDNGPVDVDEKNNFTNQPIADSHSIKVNAKNKEEVEAVYANKSEATITATITNSVTSKKPLIEASVENDHRLIRRSESHSSKSAPKQAAIKKPRKLSPEALDTQRYEKASQLLANSGYTSAINYLSVQLPKKIMVVKALRYFKSVILNISLMIEAQRFLEAEDLLVLYSQAHPSNRDFYKLNIRLALAQQEYISALALLDEYSIPINQDPEFTEFRAVIQHIQGNYAQAQSSYKQLLQFNNRRSRWWMGLAIALDASANFEGAGQAYRQALLTVDLSSAHGTYASRRITELAQ